MKLISRLEKLKSGTVFDLIIIGGGINGAGVARDAASRGLKVLLLEKGDYASGCSAHSTRLIHGGLRYLEHMEFNLVYESLQEREILLRNYPHLVNPLGLFIPSYKKNDLPLWKLNIGMILYDLLSYNKSLKPYQGVSLKDVSNMALDITTKDLLGGVYYYDGQISFAERLCLDNIRTAESLGAICINHAEVSEIKCEKLPGDKYQVNGVRFKDLLNQKRIVDVKSKYVINMAGPWVDSLNSKLRVGGLPATPLNRRIGGTKGSHIVVRAFAGGPNKFGIYSEAKSDGRPFFILPFKVGMNEDLYLIGTTDIFVDKDDIDNLQISQREIEYLLSEANAAFPFAGLSQKDIVKTFCGVRPLPYVDPKKAHSAGQVTRKHFIIDHKSENVLHYYSVVGGKWTTFRSLANEIVSKFSKEPSLTAAQKTISCRFDDYDFISYLQKYTEKYALEYKLNNNTIMHLLMLYGSKASEVLDLTREDPSLANRIDDEFEDIEAQIVYAIRNESAFTIDDILNRRLAIGLCRDKKQINPTVFKVIGNHLANEFELNVREREEIVRSYLSEQKL